MEIRPSILAQTEAEFRLKTEKIRSLHLSAHIDVMDGFYVPYKTWADPLIAEEILGDLPFSAHLMVENPEHLVPVWAVTNANVVYFHIETTNRGKMIHRAIKQENKLGVALNPSTPVSAIMPIIDVVSSVLIMSVIPGKSGQTFQESALLKIRDIKQMRPKMHVIVDGGVKPHNIAVIEATGADAVVVGSALTDTPDPTLAYNKLLANLKTKSLA